MLWLLAPCQRGGVRLLACSELKGCLEVQLGGRLLLPHGLIQLQQKLGVLQGGISCEEGQAGLGLWGAATERLGQKQAPGRREPW